MSLLENPQRLSKLRLVVDTLFIGAVAACLFSSLQRPYLTGEGVSPIAKMLVAGLMIASFFAWLFSLPEESRKKASKLALGFSLVSLFIVAISVLSFPPQLLLEGAFEKLGRWAMGSSATLTEALPHQIVGRLLTAHALLSVASLAALTVFWLRAIYFVVVKPAFFRFAYAAAAGVVLSLGLRELSEFPSGQLTQVVTCYNKHAQRSSATGPEKRLDMTVLDLYWCK